MARIIAISTAAMNALMLSPHLRFRTGLLCGHVDDDAHGWIDERELAAKVRKRHSVQLWITGRYGLRQRVQSAEHQTRGYLGSHGGRNLETWCCAGLANFGIYTCLLLGAAVRQAIADGRQPIVRCGAGRDR